jgi:hypothetical protein
MKVRVVVWPLVLLYPLYAGVMFGMQGRILFPASSGKHHAFQEPLPAGGELVENVRFVRQSTCGVLARTGWRRTAASRTLYTRQL